MHDRCWAELLPADKCPFEGRVPSTDLCFPAWLSVYEGSLEAACMLLSISIPLRLSVSTKEPLHRDSIVCSCAVW